MREALKNKLIAASGAGAIAIASLVVSDFEGYETKPYRDVAGVLTVCYGHTGNDIIVNKIYTEEECEELLAKDLAIAQRAVDPVVKYPLDEYQLAALYSFTYNVGAGAFQRSTLLKKLNAGDLPGACLELRRWVYAGGKKWKGLMTRREVEKELCDGALSK